MHELTGCGEIGRRDFRDGLPTGDPDCGSNIGEWPESEDRHEGSSPSNPITPASLGGRVSEKLKSAKRRAFIAFGKAVAKGAADLFHTSLPSPISEIPKFVKFRKSDLRTKCKIELDFKNCVPTTPKRVE